MAAPANTYVSSSATGNREELSDVVTRITPEDTPIYSMINSKERITSTSPEWEKDDLAAPADNKHPEGDEFAYTATTAPDRLRNYTQIFRKSFIISATQDAVSNAGNYEQSGQQLAKRMVEFKKDVEFSILNNNASVAAGTRELGGLPSWYETNALRGATGADGGYNTGTNLTVAATNGTLRTFTKSLLDTALQQIYVAGGNVDYMVCSPYIKSVFATFMSDSNVAALRTFTNDKKNVTVVGTVDVYQGPHGTVKVVPNRVQSVSADLARNVHLLDTTMLAFKWLRPMFYKKGAEDSDGKKHNVIGEGTLCVKNEAGLGTVADVFGLTATT